MGGKQTGRSNPQKYLLAFAHPLVLSFPQELAKEKNYPRRQPELRCPLPSASAALCPSLLMSAVINRSLSLSPCLASWNQISTHHLSKTRSGHAFQGSFLYPESRRSILSSLTFGASLCCPKPPLSTLFPTSLLSKHFLYSDQTTILILTGW